LGGDRGGPRTGRAADDPVARQDRRVRRKARHPPDLARSHAHRGNRAGAGRGGRLSATSASAGEPAILDLVDREWAGRRAGSFCGRAGPVLLGQNEFPRAERVNGSSSGAKGLSLVHRDAPREAVDAEERRRNVLLLRWLSIITTSYLL